MKSEKQKTITLNVKSNKKNKTMPGLKRSIKTEITDFLENND